jgi:hypothetical protein
MFAKYVMLKITASTLNARICRCNKLAMFCAALLVNNQIASGKSECRLNFYKSVAKCATLLACLGLAGYYCNRLGFLLGLHQ